MWYNMLVRLIQNQASPPKNKKYLKKGLTNYQTYDIITTEDKTRADKTQNETLLSA